MSTTFTTTIEGRTVPGASYMSSASLTGPTSYSTGGVAITPSMFNFNVIDFLLVISVSGGLDAFWDKANSKLKLIFPTGGASAPSTVVAPEAAVNSGSATASAVDATTPTIALTAGVGKEVAASTDVSGVTVRVLVFGR